MRRAPVVTILPTGDEVRPIGSDLAPGELLDTNSLMLAGQARELGYHVLVLPIEPDDPERLTSAIRDAVGRCDLVIVIAGSSAGRDDHTAMLVSELGTLAVHGVAVRPGHPVVLGAVDATPVLGAPGYPVSASLTFDIFAAPLLAELEGAPTTPRPVTEARLARKLASTMGMDDWVRVRLGRVGGSLVATPLPRGAGVLTSLVRADGLLVVPADVEGHHAGEQVPVTLLRDLAQIDHTIVAIGSHDLILDLAASSLRADHPELTLASSNVGSMGGLIAVRDGLCHLAGSHLLDPGTGEYTLPYLDRLLPDRRTAVIRLVHREQGLLVAPGNPLDLRGVADLARPGLRYVNRQRGAGTRVLLDFELAPGADRPRRRSVDTRARSPPTSRWPRRLPRAAPTAVWGSEPPPARSELDFVPVTSEPYDLVLDPASVESPLLAPLWQLLRSPDFRAAVEQLGGYDTTEMGPAHPLSRELTAAHGGAQDHLLGVNRQVVSADRLVVDAVALHRLVVLVQPVLIGRLGGRRTPHRRASTLRVARHHPRSDAAACP